MPIPKPKPDQSQAEYIAVCMTAIANEYDDMAQAIAVCIDAYKTAHENDESTDYEDLEQNDQ